jgi:hypothetical protein
MRSSLLNWTRWMIRARRAHPAFGAGEITFLRPANGKVLAYLRHDGAEVILCVANLCETAQATQLDLAAWSGRVPVEMFGGCRFPAIAGKPYTVTLPGHGFLWLMLIPADEVGAAECVPLERARPDLPAPDRPLPMRPREKDPSIVENERRREGEQRGSG